MCYMKNDTSVGVRELRQNLSKYLRRVERGETLEVTEHGHPVAVLAPLPAGGPLQRLIDAGKSTRPKAKLTDLPAPRGQVSTRLSEALAAERADRLD